MYKLKTQSSLSANTSGTTLANENFEIKNEANNLEPSFKFQLRLEGIGLSLINSRHQELAYSVLRGVEISFSDSTLFQTIGGKIKWVQIDNQLYGGIYPILVYPSVVRKTGKEIEAHPTFNFLVSLVKDDRFGVVFVKYATMLLQEMAIEIDEDFLYAALDLVKAPQAKWEEDYGGKLCDDNLEIPEPTIDNSGREIYFERLELQPLQFNLSFVRTERVDVEDRASSSQGAIAFVINILTMAMGSINDAPLKFNALLFQNLRAPIPLFQQLIQQFYQNQIIGQLHNVLGSADLLGNPIGLFNSVSSGFQDIFYEPMNGFVVSDRPQDFGLGLAKGTASFVRKTVFGVSDSVAKVTGSISKGLTVATMDRQYQSRRRTARNRNRPKHALVGVSSGANSFFSSVASGFEGLARKPFEGAEREGASGFFKGMGKGIVGLATKPVVGMLDLATNVSEGIRNTTTVFDEDGIDRTRLPRYIGGDGVVRPYSDIDAMGLFWLKQVNDGQFSNEQYLGHLKLPSEKLVLVTSSRIMLVQSEKFKSEWDVLFRDLQTISREKTGIQLIMRGEISRKTQIFHLANVEGGVQGPFIPISAVSSRDYLYKRISQAVHEINSQSTGMAA